ncbi:MAG: hypothetical protein ACRD2L_19290 [Terriglobia bacterium]
METTRREEIIQQLKLEKSILEDGGYGRSVRTPRKPNIYFRDSITCPNHGCAKGIKSMTKCEKKSLTQNYYWVDFPAIESLKQSFLSLSIHAQIFKQLRAAR